MAIPGIWDWSVALLVNVGVFSIAVAGCWAWRAYLAGRFRSGWLWLRVETLGGVTTLERGLRYECALCQYSMDAHEKVRKLSCGHVFHSRATEKCMQGAIEKWLYEQNLICPFCRETATPVCPWNARPPLSASSSASASALPEQSPASSSEQEHLLPLSTPVMDDEEEQQPRLLVSP